MKVEHYCTVCGNNWESKKIKDTCELCGNPYTIKTPKGNMKTDLFETLLLNGANFKNEWKFCYDNSTDDELNFTFEGKFKKIEFNIKFKNKIKKLKLNFNDINAIFKAVNPNLDILYYEFHIKKRIKGYNCNQFYIIKDENYKIAFYNPETYELKIFNIEQLCIE